MIADVQSVSLCGFIQIDCVKRGGGGGKQQKPQLLHFQHFHSPALGKRVVEFLRVVGVFLKLGLASHGHSPHLQRQSCG